MPDTIVYEQPLNERIRAFLRLEKLFRQFSWHCKHGSEWNNPIAIDALIELMAITTRSDVKLEVHKELERQHSRLQSLAQRPQIDQKQLDSILSNLKQRITEMQQSAGQMGKELQSVELLNAVRQKNSLPGCICDFDLPALRFWLTREAALQQKHLEKWYAAFSHLDRAVQLILDVIRHSVEATDETAGNGFYQQSLDTSASMQLLRIRLDRQLACYPEISAGKHRFSVRFMANSNPDQRAEQCKQDVPFQLQICAI